MPKEVFVIDDDIDDQQFFCDAFEAIDRSIICREFSGCVIALDFFADDKRQLPTYIFIDVSMPKMGGKECLVAIKANHLLKGIPVFIISGYITEEQRLELTGLGASGFVTKPDSFEKLKDEISRLVSALDAVDGMAA